MTEPGSSVESDQPAAVTARERRLSFALSVIVSINLLAICGVATFAFLVTHF